MFNVHCCVISFLSDDRELLNTDKTSARRCCCPQVLGRTEANHKFSRYCSAELLTQSSESCRCAAWLPQPPCSHATYP